MKNYTKLMLLGTSLLTADLYAGGGDQPNSSINEEKEESFSLKKLKVVVADLKSPEPLMST